MAEFEKESPKLFTLAESGNVVDAALLPIVDQLAAPVVGIIAIS